MLNPNSKSGGLAYSEKSKINHDNSKERDALNDGFENEDLDNDEIDTSTEQELMPMEKLIKKIIHQTNNNEQELTSLKHEEYDDLASSGT